MIGYEALTPQIIVLGFGVVCMGIVFCGVAPQVSRFIMGIVFVATVLAVIVSLTVELLP
jgi:hypothetical protein